MRAGPTRLAEVDFPALVGAVALAGEAATKTRARENNQGENGDGMANVQAGSRGTSLYRR
jgi:hypothetical protein